MTNLSALTTYELGQVDASLKLIDDALVLLLERGVCDESDSVDLESLADAVASEIEARAEEDGAYRVAEALACGQIVEVLRPDGAIGYAPLYQ